MQYKLKIPKHIGSTLHTSLTIYAVAIHA